MAANECRKRVRIHVKGLRNAELHPLYQDLLSMVEGVLRVQINPHSERVLIEYDDRKVETWQLTALAGRLREHGNQLETATTYTLAQQKTSLAIPVVLLGAILTRRLFLGRSKLADNLIVFEIATLVSVFSGYPPLRARVRRMAEKMAVSDDLLLTGAALFLAVIRESSLVFIALFLLTYNSYRRRNNTLSAVTKAGETVAGIDHENIEPRHVLQYGRIASHTGMGLAALAVVLKRDPLLASAFLIAANPRPATISARYALSYAETVTHEQCQFIPMHTGMDLYEMKDAKEIILLHADDDQRLQTKEAIQSLIATANRSGIKIVKRVHISQFTEPIPTQKGRQANQPLQKIVLLADDVDYPAVHQRQGSLLYLRGNEFSLQNTLQLSQVLYKHIHRTTYLTGLCNLAAVLFTLRGAPAERVNQMTDGFTLLTLALSNSLFPKQTQGLDGTRLH